MFAPNRRDKASSTVRFTTSIHQNHTSSHNSHATTNQCQLLRGRCRGTRRLRRSFWLRTIFSFACENLLSSSTTSWSPFPAGEGFLTTVTPAPTPRSCQPIIFDGRSQNVPTGCGGFIAACRFTLVMFKKTIIGREDFSLPMAYDEF